MIWSISIIIKNLLNKESCWALPLLKNLECLMNRDCHLLSFLRMKGFRCSNLFWSVLPTLKKVTVPILSLCVNVKQLSIVNCLCCPSNEIYKKINYKKIGRWSHPWFQFSITSICIFRSLLKNSTLMTKIMQTLSLFFWDQKLG